MRCHGGAVYRLKVREDCLNLWKDVAAESLGRHRSQDDGDVKDFRRLGQAGHIVDERLPVNGLDGESHLRLVVNENHRTVVRGE